MCARDERGSISVLVVIWLPLILVCAALVTDLGRAIVARGRIQAASDFAALAAVQNVDLDRLYEGVPVLLEDRAIDDAVNWAQQNLYASLPRINANDRVLVEPSVYNGSHTSPLVNRRTGRVINDPTVSVCVEVPWSTKGSWLPIRCLLRAIGDASVMRISS